MEKRHDSSPKRVGGPAREEVTMQAHVPMNTEDMVTTSAANEH